MKDSYGRDIQYLRISVTDRCNLRCRYCMPEEGVQSVSHQDILRYDEIVRLARITARLGVKRLRLTGGEPLVRKGIQDLAADLKQIEGIRFLGITTNAVLLGELAEPLCKAGVDGLNISMDTTDPTRFFALTRRDEWERAWNGLQAALALPFQSVKINCVLAPDSQPEDWLGVVGLARELPVDVRLIEWMPMADEKGPKAVPADAALRIIGEQYGPLTSVGQTRGAGPASYYTISGFRGRLGIIPAMSHCFCDGCNRMRLTATGDLKLCLFYDVGIALRPLLRDGASDEELQNAILRAVKDKPKQHQGHRLGGENEDSSLIQRPEGMFGIGG